MAGQGGQHPVSQIARLNPQFRHGDALPELAFAGGAQGVKPRLHLAGGIKQSAMGIARAPQGQRVRAQQTPFPQTDQQGLPAAAVGQGNSGAQDQPVHGDVLAHGCASATDPQPPSGPLRVAAQKPGGQDVQLPRALQAIQQRVQVRSDAVAVHIPDHRRVAQEATALPLPEPLPEGLGLGTEPIDHGPPVLAFTGGLIGPGPDQAPQAENVRRGLGGIEPVAQRRDAAVGVGTVAAAGEGHDGPAMALTVQAHHHVHHGQAGAQQSHRRLGIQLRGGLRRPPVPDPLPRLYARWDGAVAPGEHHLLRLDRRLPLEVQPVARTCHRGGRLRWQALEIDQFVADPLQRDLPLGQALRVAQDRLQVEPVELTRNEAAGIRS